VTLPDRAKSSVIELAGGRMGGGERLFIIAGPCVVEEIDVMRQTAEVLSRLAQKLGIVYVYKSSYKKANRSSVKTPTGPGLDKGLEILSRIKEEFSLPICTDIHESAEAAPAAQVADVLQIPAFLSRQTDLLHAAAATGRVVNIKKGQFMGPELAVLAAEKVRHFGGDRVLLTERGSFFGYNDLVVDFRSLQVMAASLSPLVFDVTHSVQTPGGTGESSGGKREFIPLLSRAAVAAGVDGLFMEVHPDPASALSDRQCMVSTEEAESLIPSLVELGDYVRDKW
jgi:2-dehydro-3-deoxyphosphooctonate aldolase (KDO 8-P synthase)